MDPPPRRHPVSRETKVEKDGLAPPPQRPVKLTRREKEMQKAMQEAIDLVCYENME